ncbi:hypothetical protein [Nocardia aurea]|uniref:hypothetical protein n=1 Tax=Nocardia aurea TaxID=2144174 RepID=UPI00339EB0CD
MSLPQCGGLEKRDPMPCCLLAGYLSAGAHRLWRRVRGRPVASAEFAPTALRPGPAAPRTARTEAA